MMRAIRIFALLFLIVPTARASTSIYGSKFDYLKAQPANVYYQGKSAKEIELHCAKEHLGTMDLSACAQFKYENLAKQLNKKISEVEKTEKDVDRQLRANGEPEALPFFKKAQAAWLIYRDNQCYSNVYSVGQASLRFVAFWDCMTRMTKNRLNELSWPDSDD